MGYLNLDLVGLILFATCQRLGRRGFLRVHKFSVWGVLERGFLPEG